MCYLPMFQSTMDDIYNDGPIKLYQLVTSQPSYILSNGHTSMNHLRAHFSEQLPVINVCMTVLPGKRPILYSSGQIVTFDLLHLSFLALRRKSATP